MNKFCGPLDSDPDYKSVVEVIKRFLLTIQDGTALEQADAWIREKYYDKQRLKIERLSGESLEMSECYINLALVEVHKVDNSERRSEGPSPFSLSERLKLEPLNDDLRVELPDLFQPREMPCGGTKMPRRILIRGRAGVGKTTLCKKIVYDFIHGGMWEDLFKRVVWIRLRELKSFPNDDYSFDRVLRNIFFRQHRQYSKLCTELWRHIEDTQSRDTVFLLDGLDEVPELTMEYKHGNPHPGQDLLKGLLNRPNVIITTRPHATFPTDFRQPDLELDTMGFSESQVFSYLEAVIPEDIDAIEAYLENHRIMKSLVQIPIQLDALCFTWQTSSIWNTDIPDTMTAVYEAMTRELWKKDNERLEKDGIQIIGNASPAETDPFDSTQYESLGYLAFSGLCSNVIEFQPHHRNTLYRFMKKERTSLSFDETFARLSFWRTSDSSNTLPNPSYHFIHLTFQEYFSAKHFAKAWRQENDLEYIEFDGKRHKKQLVSCQKFFQKHKFNTRYNIMWRFVAEILDEDDGQTCRFFEVIEGEPVDMLGSAQQRLVMHCLAEVTQSAQLRTRLENQLSQWLDFELNFRGFSHFFLEPEFPARAINLVLARASMEHKFAILEEFKSGHNLPLSTVELITGWLERGELPPSLRLVALEALPKIPLPIRTLNAVVALMDNEDRDTTGLVIFILCGQAPWPSDILRAVMARHESQDSDKDLGIKQRTANALRGDSELPMALLLQIASWINDLCPPTTKAVLQTLEYQRNLNEDIIRIIATVLKDQQQEMRVFAFKMLQERDDLPLDILDTMATHLEAEHRSVYMTLRPSDNILRVLMKRLESQDRSIQQKALQVLCRVHNKRPELPFHDVFRVLVEWLEGEDYGSRQLALIILYGQQELPERITKAVMALLEDQNQETSHLAFHVLFLQGNSPMRVMDGTIRRLRFGDRDEKRWILAFLEGEYLLPPGVLKAIAQNLNDRDRDIRTTALDTLRALGGSQDFPDDVIVAIAEQIFHADMTTRRAAAETLAKVWDRQNLPVELLDAIVAQLKSHNPAIREAASDSLVDFGGLHSIFDETLNAIALHLADPESHIRCGAAKTLRRIAHNQVFPDYILSAIAALLEDRQREIRYESVMTLHTVAKNETFPDHFLQPIAALLRDTDKGIQLKALETLGRLGYRRSFPPHILDAIADQIENPEVEGYMPLGKDYLSFSQAQALIYTDTGNTYSGSASDYSESSVDTSGDTMPVSPTYRQRAAFEALVRQSGLPEVTAEAIVVRGLASRDPKIRRPALYMVRRLPTMSKEIRGLVVALLDD
ncbi:hypothetical protein NW768_011806 [Fusarium equiseti]|uniref:NACHT domain-containing protein n=1 Tax=Fusarium equiseti TaxID=61235 RepID=A0ABQ8QX36_FUSEQ|nr:hypothetical protein NW768_011806 [Fusarium equiseti]